MTRAAVALAFSLAAAAGCGHSFGPCDGTCVDVTVTYGGAAAVLELAITGSSPDGFSSHLDLPAAPAGPIDFPAYFTLHLPSPHSPLTLSVAALDGAATVAGGGALVSPVAGARVAVTIPLGPLATDGGADARDAASPDLARSDGPPDAAASDAAPDGAPADLAPEDGGLIALTRFACFTGPNGGPYDISVDGLFVEKALTVGQVGAYHPIAAGTHKIQLSSAGNTLATASIDLEPPMLTTVWAWQANCKNVYTLEQASISPTPAAGMADIDIFNVNCANTSESYIIDVKNGGTAQPNHVVHDSVTPAKHTVERLFLPMIDVTTAAGEVWSVFDYTDRTGQEQMESARDVP